MLKNLLKLLFIPAFTLVVSMAFIAPETATAQGMIPCEGAGCNFCHFVTLANNVIAWLIGVLAVVFGVMVFAAGIGLVTSGGNPGKLEDAKKSLTNALIGLIIVLASWLIIDTLLKATLQQTGPSSIGPWNQVECSASQVAGDPYTSTSVIPVPTPAAAVGCVGGACYALMPTMCKNPDSCSLAQSMAGAAQEFHNSVNNIQGIANVRVTESMPPTRTHKNLCHIDGTCFDYGRAGGLNANEIFKIMNTATNIGFRPVYEVSTQAQKDAILKAEPKIDPACIIVETSITAAHFSVYQSRPSAPVDCIK